MAGSSQLDFKEIFSETEDSIRARIEGDADPDIDKRPGEFFYDVTAPIIKEMNRLWDAMNTTTSVGFLPWSYGVYLDYKGENEIGLPRKQATRGNGTVTFIGTRNTLIPSGTSVSTVARRPTDPTYQFTTTATDEIGMDAPLVAPTTVSGAAGAITNTVSYVVTFVGRGGETEAGPASTPLAVTAKIVELSGIPIGPSGTTSRKIYRQGGGSGSYTLLATLTDNATTVYSDNNNTFPPSATVAPVTNTTDRVDISVEAVAEGKDYNVAAAAISLLVDSISGVSSLTNAVAIANGSDRESDLDYTRRLRTAIASPSGQGNKADYRTWATQVDGVQSATIVPLAFGNNTVQVVLLGPDNAPVSASVVTEVQTLLDPNSNGDGSGLAPIGAVVTVQSVAAVNLTVTATVTLATGTTLDGTNSTGAARQDIIDAINEYLQSLEAGDDVIWAKVFSAISDVPSVLDVNTNLSLNGGASGANVAITSVQVPVLTTVTLTAV